MIDAKKVKQYIEEKNNIKLTSMQYQILKAIIRGDTIYTYRGIGRSMLYNGYADYLKDVISKDTDRTIALNEFDSMFTAQMLINNICDTKNEESIRRKFKIFPELFSQ